MGSFPDLRFNNADRRDYTFLLKLINRTTPEAGTAEGGLLISNEQGARTRDSRTRASGDGKSVIALRALILEGEKKR